MNQRRETPLFCHCCGCDLIPGRGNFYVVRIEAFADPTPPKVGAEADAGDAETDPGEEIDRLIETMREMSHQELMDQVHRRLTIHLCLPCYTCWIENPAARQ